MAMIVEKRETEKWRNGKRKSENGETESGKQKVEKRKVAIPSGGKPAVGSWKSGFQRYRWEQKLCRTSLIVHHYF
jgi:hypothetical protein